MSINVYLIAILANYMFRLLLAIFSLSSREIKILLYPLCAQVVQRSLHRALLRNVISICGGMLWLEAWESLMASVKFEGSSCAGIVNRRIPPPSS
jgi:hypothetical protein